MEEEIPDPSKNDVYMGIHIMNEIIPPNNLGKGGLYLGRVHMLEREQQLKQLNIGAVLSIYEFPLKINPSRKIKHKQIDISDDEDKDLSQYFEETHKFISENLKNTNVYVHCALGVSRSSSIVIAYLMKERRQNYQKAYEYVFSKRDCIRPNDGFQQQLKKYSLKLKLE